MHSFNMLGVRCPVSVLCLANALSIASCFQYVASKCGSFTLELTGIHGRSFQSKICSALIFNDSDYRARN